MTVIGSNQGMPNQTKFPRYRSQVLRMWSESPAHQLPLWRFSLEEIGTGVRSGFADLDALIEHLLDLMEQHSEQLSNVQSE